MNILRTATVAAVLALSAQVSANPVVEFTINLDSFNGQETAVLDTLIVGGLEATSVYSNNGSVSAGTEGTDLVGETLAFNDTGTSSIASLLGLVNANNAEFASTWGLDIGYSLEGQATFLDCVSTECIAGQATFAALVGSGLYTEAEAAAFIAATPGLELPDGTISSDGLTLDATDAILPTFTDGSLDIFFNEFDGAGFPTEPLAGGQQLISFGFAGFELDTAGVILLGTGDYSWYNPADNNDLVENFFIDTKTGLSFYDMWLLNPLEPVTVGLRFDFNVDGRDLPLCEDEACAVLTRTTELDGSITFSPVPAPVPLALMGVGLLALGAARRRKAA